MEGQKATLEAATVSKSYNGPSFFFFFLPEGFESLFLAGDGMNPFSMTFQRMASELATDKLVAAASMPVSLMPLGSVPGLRAAGPSSALLSLRQ